MSKTLADEMIWIIKNRGEEVAQEKMNGMNGMYNAFLKEHPNMDQDDLSDILQMAFNKMDKYANSPDGASMQIGKLIEYHAHNLQGTYKKIQRRMLMSKDERIRKAAEAHKNGDL